MATVLRFGRDVEAGMSNSAYRRGSFFRGAGICLVFGSFVGIVCCVSAGMGGDVRVSVCLPLGGWGDIVHRIAGGAFAVDGYRGAKLVRSGRRYRAFVCT